MGGSAVLTPLTESITELYLDAVACAEVAGLRYTSDEEPGIRRRRRGRGFSYVDASGRPVPAAVRARLDALAVPPAWREVWLSAEESAHLLATGLDDRGRKQYLYHARWRELRELINFSRLVPFADQLPSLRSRIDAQLRRRTIDRERVLASMLRIIDETAIRIGNEVYADENSSYGLTTLTRRHVTVSAAGTVRMCFPAKSGRRAEVDCCDPRVARVVRVLLGQRHRRVFTVGARAISADDVNTTLADWTGTHVTAKDFRTWHGTRVAFETIESMFGTAEPDVVVLAAVDAAAAHLGNTRAVARESYVHPQLLQAVADGTFDRLRPSRTPRGPAGLTGPERRLRGFLANAWTDVPALPTSPPSPPSRGE